MKNIFLGLPEATSDMLAYAYTKWANPDRDADWWIRTGASYMSTDQGWAWDGTGNSRELFSICVPGPGLLHCPGTSAHP